jgi:alpha-tubulin suppressor-like RCC1 family protein
MLLLRNRALLCIALAVGALLGGCSYDDAAGPGDRVDITPTNDSIVAGTSITPEDTVRLDATVISNQGIPLPNAPVTWTSSDESVATVDSAGLVTAVGFGTAQITARSGDREAVAVITVVRDENTAGGDTLFARISAARDFSCATTTGGRAYCWGIDSVEQLGSAVADSVCYDNYGIQFIDDSTALIQPFECSLRPERVQNEGTLTHVDGGYAHGCAVDDLGRAFCWGKGPLGRLGNGSIEDVDVPSLVTSALAFDSISTGDAHTCALTPDGAAWCWGADGFGQLGNLMRATSTTPIPVEGGLTFKSISAGTRRTCALTTDGAAYCWGDNRGGQLGNGTLVLSDTAIAVAGGITFASISVGDTSVCGVATSGALYCWGENAEGQLGNGGFVGSTTPVQVPGGPFRTVSVGGTHACALTVPAGELYCWGRYFLGVLRPNAGERDFIGATPTKIGSVTFTEVDSGLRHSCGVTGEGAAYCWGSNLLGPFGDGLQQLLRPEPQRVKAPL